MSEPDSRDENAQNIEQWLEGIRLPQYAANFLANDITLEMLPGLSDADLKACGVESLGHRKILLGKIHEQFSNTAPALPKQKPPLTVPAGLVASGARRIVVKPLAPSVKSAGPVPEKPAVALASASISPPRAAPAIFAVGAGEEPAPPRRKLWRRLLGSQIILLSIAVHVLLGVVATFYIVQTIQAKRKLTFQGGPPSPNRSTRALEHKVSVARRSRP